MTMKLTQKETSLLKDQQNHEKVCIQKYQAYASQASDPQLKQLLTSYAEQEQQHLNTINQMLSGQVPTMSSSASQSGAQSSMATSSASSSQGLASQQSGAQSSMPTFSSSASQGVTSQQSGMQSSTATSSMSASQGATNSQSDSALCNDMLMTEKFVSGAYDTAIFECTNTNIRQALNHIQKEEQGHGEGLFQYMQSKGMYNTQ
jgi:spore coat protein CotF